ncbi:MAG: hypothetical protein U1A77_12160 [Pirellulales bacterium]
MRMSQLIAVGCMIVGLGTFELSAIEADQPSRKERPKTTAERLTRWHAAIEGDAPADNPLQGMWSRDLRERRRAIVREDVAAWESLKSREDWERLREERLEKLRRAIGDFPPPPSDLRGRVTRTHDGEGYRVECWVFESRPGLWVTANVYRPQPARDSMPGILICHSHHRPKTQDELQEMGATWARAGCVVIVPDMLGHGERRQHPFRTADDWPTAFRIDRQDYQFRYNLGMQLHLIGDSLMGWFAWDLSRCVDWLLTQPGVDRQRIALLGAVAGGGDPAAVAAALDRRITVAVPFNFGGPQPESEYPLPADAASSFNYVGGGSFESTRNLTGTGAGKFFPWVIVGAIAPRPLVYAHEFTWDRERDPVWKRLEKIYSWYGKPGDLSSTNGWGKVTQSSSEASHCTNIGRPHRKAIHAAFESWLAIPTPELEWTRRLEAKQLWCVEGNDAAKEVKLTPVVELAKQVAMERGNAFQQRLAKAEPDQRRVLLREAWRERLALQTPSTAPTFTAIKVAGDDPRVVRGWLKMEREMTLPVTLLLPDSPQAAEKPDGKSDGKSTASTKAPVVVVICQQGQAGLLKHRTAEIAQLLDNGFAVCLPDLRGCGASQADAGRGRRSSATSLSSSELLLGGTALGGQLHDLLAVLLWLKDRPEVKQDSVGIWGESLVEANGPNVRTDTPHDASPEAKIGEPGAGVLALLASLFDDRVERVLARGMIGGYTTFLDGPFVHVPHDVVVPGALTLGDLADVAAVAGPAALRLDRVIDAANRPLDQERLSALWSRTRQAYTTRKASLQLQGAAVEPADWFRGD